jgi:hypothetical protein
MDRQLSGVVVRVAGALRFVPGQVAHKMVYMTAVSRVPGTIIGMALVGGQVVSVIDLGPASGQLLVCELDGELVAFAGIHALAAGWYEAAEGGGIRFEDQHIPELDLVGEMRRVEQQLWLRGGQEREADEA